MPNARHTMFDAVLELEAACEALRDSVEDSDKRQADIDKIVAGMSSTERQEFAKYRLSH